MEKGFHFWNRIKIGINESKRCPTFNERQIWWCNIGINIGYEMNGKNKPVHRPVLIVKKFNKHTFWGIPLTTKIKDIPFYHSFKFKGINQCVVLCQLRLFDSKRLTDSMGWISPVQFQKIKHKLIRTLQGTSI